MARRTLEAQFSKIARAKALMGEFAKQVDIYRSLAEIKIYHVPDEAGLIHVTLRSDQVIQDDAPILAAEVVYHVRSALDQMVVEIGRQCGVNNTDHLYFPFTRYRSEFGDKRTQGKMKGLPQDVREMLEKLEPYEDGNERLWGIGAFANIDKHKMLIPIVAVGRAGAINGVVADGGAHPGSVGLLVGEEANLNEGLVISKMGPTGKFEVHGSLGLAVDFAFADVPAFAGHHAVPTLHGLVDLSETILESFSAHCFGQ